MKFNGATLVNLADSGGVDFFSLKIEIAPQSYECRTQQQKKRVDGQDGVLGVRNVANAGLQTFAGSQSEAAFCWRRANICNHMFPASCCVAMTFRNSVKRECSL